MPATPLTNQLQICPCGTGESTVCLPGQPVIGPGTAAVVTVLVPQGKVLELIAWNIPANGRVSVNLFDGGECQSALSFPFFPCGAKDISLTYTNRTTYLGAGTYQLTATGSTADYLIKPAVALLEMGAKELRDLQCACSCAITPAVFPCPFTFTATDLIITAPGRFHHLEVTGPAGATFNLNIVGTVNGAAFNAANPVTIPASGIWMFDTAPSVIGDVASFAFSITPTGPSAGATVCGGPFTVSTNVPVGCPFTFTATNLTITTAGQFHHLEVVGPPGATFNLNIVGTINGTPFNVANPVTIPTNGTWAFDTAPSTAGDVASFVFSATPTGANASAVVCGGPFTVSTNVPSAGPCPTLADDFSPAPVGYTCGGTTNYLSGIVGQPFSFIQNFVNSASTTGGSTIPGVSSVPVGPTTVIASGVPTAAGTFALTFSGAKPGCTACAVTHIVVIASNIPS